MNIYKYTLTLYNIKMNLKDMVPQNINGYRILKCIGEGGNGTVYECEDKNSRRRYAIKFCMHSDFKSLRRFWDEIYIVKQLQSNGCTIPIVYTNVPDNWDTLEKHIKERIDINENFYYVSELAEKLNVDDLLSKELCDRVNFINQIFDILINLHNKKIYHRDIKLDNILKFNNKYVLADFGLVTYPNKLHITKNREPLGGISAFDPISSIGHKSIINDQWLFDVCEFAKVIWFVVRGRCNKDKIIGQYVTSNNRFNLFNYIVDYETSFLSNLLSRCTDLEDISNRPNMDTFKVEFNKWWSNNCNAESRNKGIWNDILYNILGLNYNARMVEWDDESSCKRIIDLILPRLNYIKIEPHVKSLNPDSVNKIVVEKSNNQYSIQMITTDNKQITVSSL